MNKKSKEKLKHIMDQLQNDFYRQMKKIGYTMVGIASYGEARTAMASIIFHAPICRTQLCATSTRFGRKAFSERSAETSSVISASRK